jgi:hypothetical protein
MFKLMESRTLTRGGENWPCIQKGCERGVCWGWGGVPHRRINKVSRPKKKEMFPTTTHVLHMPESCKLSLQLCLECKEEDYVL